MLYNLVLYSYTNGKYDMIKEHISLDIMTLE